jgi:glutamine synthetase
MKVKLEYIWLDGYHPEQNLRSKTKVWDYDPIKTPKYNSFRENGPCPEELPVWSFDGSSTQQSKGNFSDCLLKPVRVIMDPQRKKSFLVMCEVLNPDSTSHKSNTRHLIPKKEVDAGEFVNVKDFTRDNYDMWFGFEQEYTLIGKNGRPLGFPDGGFPDSQGKYYCAVGNRNVSGREIAEQHLDVCLSSGLNITGINAEVLLGQWEYQLLGMGVTRSADDLWLSRYLLHRICEQYEVHVEFHPKPVDGDWNGSGLHTNFSNKKMREIGGKEYIMNICDLLKQHHTKFIDNYGAYNNMRLTGNHETQSIDKFSVGESDRGASIRIPVGLVNNGWKGYLEDRRPASNADPYKITKLLYETILNVDNLVITE